MDFCPKLDNLEISIACNMQQSDIVRENMNLYSVSLNVSSTQVPVSVLLYTHCKSVFMLLTYSLFS